MSHLPTRVTIGETALYGSSEWRLLVPAGSPGTPLLNQTPTIAAGQSIRRSADGLSWEAYTPGGTSIAVGTAITGGGANRVLYEDGSQNLASSANFLFDGNLSLINPTTATSGAPDSHSPYLYFKARGYWTSADRPMEARLSFGYPSFYNGGSPRNAITFGIQYNIDSGGFAEPCFTHGVDPRDAAGMATCLQVRHPSVQAWGGDIVVSYDGFWAFRDAGGNYSKLTPGKMSLLNAAGTDGYAHFYANNGTYGFSMRTSWAAPIRFEQTMSGYGGDYAVLMEPLLGVGTHFRSALGNSPSAQVHIVSTTEQLRVGYDASNYLKTTIGSTGGVSFDSVGTGKGFTFNAKALFNYGTIGGSLDVFKMTGDISTGYSTINLFSIISTNTYNPSGTTNGFYMDLGTGATTTTPFTLKGDGNVLMRIDGDGAVKHYRTGAYGNDLFFDFESSQNNTYTDNRHIFSIRETGSWNNATGSFFRVMYGSTDLLKVHKSEKVSIGHGSPDAKLHVIATTEQMRLGYDASNYCKITVDSGGATKFEGVGASPGFMFPVDLSVGFAGLPSARLHVLRADGSDQLRLAFDGSNYFTTNVKSSGNVEFDSVGTSAGFTFKDIISIVSTTEQLRIGYDGSNYLKVTVGSSGVAVLDAVGSGAGITTADDVSIGLTGLPSAKLHVLSAAGDQLRLAYNSSNYCTVNVSSAGEVVFDAISSGTGNKFTFSDKVSLPSGSIIGSANTDTLSFWGHSAVAQPSDVGQLTDSTTGSAGSTLVDVDDGFGVARVASINDNFASLNAQVDELRAWARSIGLMA